MVISMNRHLFRPIVMPGLYLIKKFFKWRNIPLRNEVNFTYTEDEIRCIVEESHRSGRLNAWRTRSSRIPSISSIS